MPEKAQAQYNFCLRTADSADGLATVLWTVPDTVPKDGVLNPPIADPPSGTYREHVLSVINKASGKKRVIEPSEREFSSEIVQAHRKGEKGRPIAGFLYPPLLRLVQTPEV